MMYGVIIRIGMDNPINNVCNCVNNIDKPIPLAVPINIEKNVPAHVGHAINNPVAAPTPLIPLPFLARSFRVFDIFFHLLLLWMVTLNNDNEHDDIGVLAKLKDEIISIGIFSQRWMFAESGEEGVKRCLIFYNQPPNIS